MTLGTAQFALVVALITAVVLSAVFYGARHSNAPGAKAAESEAVARIAVMRDGRILLEGTETRLEALDKALGALAARGGKVLYYRQDGEGDPHQIAFEVLDLITKHRLPLSFSTKPDFSERLDVKSDAIHAHFEEGMAHFQSGDLDRAIASFTEAIRLDPEFPQAHYGRGSAHREKGELDQAIADYTRAIELDPKNAHAYVSRGILYGDKGRFDQTIDDLSQAINLDPKDAAAHIVRGLAWQQKGELERAIADFTQAIKLDPKQVEAYGNRGFAYESKGENERAVADYRKALALDPSFDDARRNLERLGVTP